MITSVRLRSAAFSGLLVLGLATCDYGAQAPDGSFTLSQGVVRLLAITGESSEPAQVSVEAFRGSVNELAPTVVYNSPTASWLSAMLQGTSTVPGEPVALILQASAAGLEAGTVDTANVKVESPNVRDAGTIRMILTVQGPLNALVLATGPAEHGAQRLGIDPAARDSVKDARGGDPRAGRSRSEGGNRERWRYPERTGRRNQRRHRASDLHGPHDQWPGGPSSAPILGRRIRFRCLGPDRSPTGEPAQITEASSLTQNGGPNCEVSDRPRVRISDDGDNPVEGVQVTFEITAGGGSISPSTSVVSGPDGVAGLTAWTLGSSLGAQSLEAGASGLSGSPSTVAATTTIGQANKLGLSPAPSGSAASGTPFATQPAVQVQDACGNAVAQAERKSP